MDPALIELNEAGPADEEVSLILRLQDGAEPPPTVRVVCRFGPIITVRCRRGDILPTWASDRVISAKAPRPVHLPAPVGQRGAPGEIDDEAATEMAIDPEELEAFDEAEPTGGPPPPVLPVDGRGVIVGICDWGFDFTHENFRNADGSTRLLALWDQRGTGDPRAPAPYNRGRLFTTRDINAALAQPDPCAALGYHPASGDPSNTGAHGSHVCDIVAGNRRYPGSEVGLARGADLVFVHLGAQRLGELDNLGDSVGLLEGLDFVRRTAAAAGRPCVMHLSAGKTAGPHRGVTLVERAVDILLQETPGIVLVQSGGNYAQTAMHTHARIGPDQTHVIDWLIPRRDRTPNELEIWYSGMDIFDVTLVAPDGQEFSAPLAARARLGDGLDAWGNFYHRLHEPNSGLNHVAIFLYTAAPAGRWKVVVHGRDVVDGRLHAWIERDAGSRYQSRFSQAQATPSYTTNTICNSFRAIAVGAYDATHPERPPGYFSSHGPTADGRQKPEIAAPGVRIRAARSMPRDGWNGERKLVVKSGTSMAAPWVSGTVALMFQAAGRPLTIHEIRRILIGTADPHAGPRGRSSSQLGFGYLNTAAAVEAARRLGNGAVATPPSPVGSSLEHDEAQPDEPQPIGSTWVEVPLGEAVGDGEAVDGTTYSDRPGAVARGRVRQQTYMDIQIVKNAASQWEVHYDEPVPTGTPPFDDAKTFANKDDAISRARALRAYGYTVLVKPPTASRGRFCRVTGLRGRLGLPTATGPDAGFTFTTFDDADVRAHALAEVGFGTQVTRPSSTTYQVEITSLPSFLPASGTSAPAPAPASGTTTTYVVKDSDTLYSIATSHGVTVDELKSANKLTTDVIRAGNVLVIPTKASTPAPRPPVPPAPAPTPPAPAPTPTAPTTPPIATSSVGHDPGKDWSGGVLREDSFLRKSDKTTIQTSGTAKLLFLKGAAVTLKSASGTWVEVEGPVHAQAPGKSPVAAGTGTGWIERDWTSMSLGVFKDLPVDDRTAKYGALATNRVFAAGDVKKLILHQTESSTAASTLSTYWTEIHPRPPRSPSHVGSHYLIDETGAVILVVPLNKIVNHTRGSNSDSIGIEHVGRPTEFIVPSSATDTATLNAIRTGVAAMVMSPQLQARIAAMTDRQLVQFARDAWDPSDTRRPKKWALYGDIRGVQKRASWLLTRKLEAQFGLGDAAVFAHEVVAPKSPGEGENIKEFLTARASYAGRVAELARLVAADATLKADATLTRIVTSESATVDALRVDATAAENAAVTSGTDRAATARQAARDAFYARFWTRSTQLDGLVAFLKASGSTQPARLATMTGAWVF